MFIGKTLCQMQNISVMAGHYELGFSGTLALKARGATRSNLTMSNLSICTFISNKRSIKTDEVWRFYSIWYTY